MSRVAIFVSGCSMNQALGEIIKSLYRDMLVDSIQEADVIILNLCAVKKPTEDRGISLARKLIRSQKKVIITGCLAESDPIRISKLVRGAHLISLQHLLELPPEEFICRIKEAEKPIISTGLRLNICYPSKRILRNPLVGIVPIAFGCTNYCTYCLDKRIWGSIKSIPPHMLIDEVRNLLRKGVREIRITAHDVAAYGIDIGTNLVELLENILKFEDEFMIRIGMASPNTFSQIADDLLSLMKDEERIYKFIHIPVQSGSDRILRLMNRPYTIEEYVELFMKIRKFLGSESTIATDVIVAFPTESEDDHKATIRLLEELKPDITNLSRYGDRPGCMSSKIKPKIHSAVAKRRSIELFQVIRRISMEQNKKFIGSTLRVLFLERRGAFLGRAFNNRIVYVQDIVDLGNFYSAKITRATWKSLYGRVE
ncbi:MAG: tRNA (N(6)-L-threonylcarbamoyladenosine(37)-C(2))-methylthiotransferase [Candidatus Korarchaeota archaeon]|nr:tRNA (N(6)-L-threonylcarbamoyladenosine(37)-C(2))-methylthiotransferase [Thermoproteota archaeon]